MKGVILGICPAAQIVDISHGVTPFEITEGAYLIAQAWRYFPQKTVHVVVVDPGWARRAGPFWWKPAASISSRRIMACSPWSTCRRTHKVRLISNEALLPPSGEPDLSRPRHLRSGGARTWPPVCSRARCGNPIDDYLKPDFDKPHRAGKRTWIGQILKIDHFGNIVTNFHVNDFGDLAHAQLPVGAGSGGRSPRWRAITPNAARESCS